MRVFVFPVLCLMGFSSVSAQVKSWQKGVNYEIFVRSFYDSNGDGIGDLNGITQKLDYLNDGNPETETDLGISGIWLMPINPSPSYHGYDVTNYFGINPQYGTLADFKRLLDEAHKRDVKVIIDFVMNHCSVRHPWYQKARAGDPFYRNFFIWSDVRHETKGPWGQRLWHGKEAPFHYGVFSSGLPDLNFEFQPVQDSLFAAAKFWIKEVGVDGFRLDAVKFLYEEGTVLEDHPKTLAFWKQFGDSVRSWNPAAFTVAEAWTSTEIASKYVQENRLDYAFEFDLSYATIAAANSADVARLTKQVQKALSAYPNQQFGSFLTNHDQNRVIDELKNDSQKAGLAAKLLLTLPGIPYLYYGEEVGMRGSKPDEHIRRPMAWNADANAGFSTVKPWIELPQEFETKNVASQTAGASLLAEYRRFISARNKSAALTSGSFTPLSSSAPEVFSFLREKDGETIWVMANLSGKPVKNPKFSFEGTEKNGTTVKLFAYPASMKIPSRVLRLNTKVKENVLGAYAVRMYRLQSSVGAPVKE